jgi:hypothetical protein
MDTSHATLFAVAVLSPALITYVERQRAEEASGPRDAMAVG